MFKTCMAAVCGLLLGVGLACSAQAQSQADIHAAVFGTWLAQSRDAHVLITRCDDGICGKILSARPAHKNPQLLDVNNKDPNLRSRKVVGIYLMDGFSGGPVKWTGGKLYNPGDGNFYHGALTMIDDDHLQVKGCALIFLCKSQIWKRLE